VSLDDLTPLLQLGFAASMCVLIWRGYVELTKTMSGMHAQTLSVVQDNTRALTKLEAVITEHTHVTERMRTAVESLDRRVGTLEDREREKRS
jgi:hypothetical protein